MLVLRRGPGRPSALGGSDARESVREYSGRFAGAAGASGAEGASGAY